MSSAISLGFGTEMPRAKGEVAEMGDDFRLHSLVQRRICAVLSRIRS